jgi:hypothetical protein
LTFNIFQHLLLSFSKEFSEELDRQINTIFEQWGKIGNIWDHAKNLKHTLKSCSTSLSIFMDNILFPLIDAIASNWETSSECMYMFKQIYLLSCADSRNLGIIWTLIGVLRFQLLLPKHRIDPTAEMSYKYQYLSEISQDINLEIQVRTMAQEILGDSRYNSFIEELKQQFNIIANKCEKYSSKVTKIATTYLCIYTYPQIPLRPTPSQFDRIFNELQHFNATLCNSQKILSLMEALVVKDKFAYSTISQEIAWQARYH